MTKPFSLAEIVARVQAILRRTAGDLPGDVLRFGDLDPRRGAPRGLPRRDADRPDRDRVQPAPLLPAQPAPGALEGPDPAARLALRLRRQHERRRDLRELPAPQARRARPAADPDGAAGRATCSKPRTEVVSAALAARPAAARRDRARGASGCSPPTSPPTRRCARSSSIASTARSKPAHARRRAGAPARGPEPGHGPAAPGRRIELAAPAPALHQARDGLVEPGAPQFERSARRPQLPATIHLSAHAERADGDRVRPSSPCRAQAAADATASAPRSRRRIPEPSCS